MNRREERWGRERWAGDDYEWRRDPSRFRNEDTDAERRGGWDRSGEYQGRESGVRSQSGSYRRDDTNDSRDYYGGREDYRGREYRRGSEGGRASPRASGAYASEEPFGMNFDEGRVQWRRREPGEQYGLDRYGSGYEDRAGRSAYPPAGDYSRGERRWGDDGYSDYGTNYPSGQSFGDRTESYGPQGFGGGGSRLVHHRRHEQGAAWMHGPYSGVGPKGYRRSPERLREQVCDLFEEHGRLDASDIDVKIEDSTVMLTGTVESREAKRLAEDLAGSIGGVHDVGNQLKVRSRDDGPGRERSRSDITGENAERQGSSGSRATGRGASKPGL